MKKIEKLENEGPELSPSDATTFRALAARANYLAQDRPDTNFASKELCREFAVPSVDSHKRLHHLCRYLLGVPRHVYSYNAQSVNRVLTIYTGTDFAGCKATRRSTRGCLIMQGGGGTV